MTTPYTDAQKRHDFIFLFDVTDGNPNGDPDNDNLPRTDPETNQGLVTDVCLKRKVRDYVTAVKGGDVGYDVYIGHRAFLADYKKKAYDALDMKKGEDKNTDKARAWMCKNFFDIRTFGGVLVGKKGEGYNCGQVRGPVQMTFSRSIDPVFAYDLSITRVALENSGEKPRESEDDKASTGTMGRKALLPYGLYMGHGFFSPLLAKGTGFSNDDLALFWEAMQNMFGIDRSASRGMMDLRGLYVFSHDKATGNAPSHKLFSRIVLKLKDTNKVPRKFDDYTISIDEEKMPDGVKLSKLVD